jgi:CheY-like chemotaxis protein
MTLRTLRKGRLKNSLFRVRDGVEALEFVLRQGVFRARQTHHPKLIMLDLNMPTLPEIEVLRA